MVMQLRSCCCGCTLRTGAIIIAVLGIIGGIFYMAEGIFQSESSGENTKNTTVIKLPSVLGQDFKPSDFGVNLPDTYSTAMPTLSPASGNGTEPVAPGGYGWNVSKTLYGALELIICALLLAGAIKNSAKLVYPWIVVSVVLCLLHLILFVGIGIVFCVAGIVAFGLVYIVFGLIGTLIHIYFILVVNSFHTNLKAGPPVSRA